MSETPSSTRVDRWIGDYLSVAVIPIDSELRDFVLNRRKRARAIIWLLPLAVPVPCALSIGMVLLFGIKPGPIVDAVLLGGLGMSILAFALSLLRINDAFKILGWARRSLREGVIEHFELFSTTEDDLATPEHAQVMRGIMGVPYLHVFRGSLTVARFGKQIAAPLLRVRVCETLRLEDVRAQFRLTQNTDAGRPLTEEELLELQHHAAAFQASWLLIALALVFHIPALALLRSRSARTDTSDLTTGRAVAGRDQMNRPTEILEASGRVWSVQGVPSAWRRDYSAEVQKSQ